MKFVETACAEKRGSQSEEHGGNADKTIATMKNVVVTALRAIAAMRIALVATNYLRAVMKILRPALVHCGASLLGRRACGV